MLGGMGADVVTAGSGADFVLGDNGELNWDKDGRLNASVSTEMSLGGDDRG